MVTIVRGISRYIRDAPKDNNLWTLSHDGLFLTAHQSNVIYVRNGTRLSATMTECTRIDTSAPKLEGYTPYRFAFDFVNPGGDIDVRNDCLVESRWVSGRDVKSGYSSVVLGRSGDLDPRPPDTRTPRTYDLKYRKSKPSNPGVLKAYIDGEDLSDVFDATCDPGEYVEDAAYIPIVSPFTNPEPREGSIIWIVPHDDRNPSFMDPHDLYYNTEVGALQISAVACNFHAMPVIFSSQRYFVTIEANAGLGIDVAEPKIYSVYDGDVGYMNEDGTVRQAIVREFHIPEQDLAVVKNNSIEVLVDGKVATYDVNLPPNIDSGDYDWDKATAYVKGMYKDVDIINFTMSTYPTINGTRIGPPIKKIIEADFLDCTVGSVMEVNRTAYTTSYRLYPSGPQGGPIVSYVEPYYILIDRIDRRRTRKLAKTVAAGKPVRKNTFKGNKAGKKHAVTKSAVTKGRGTPIVPPKSKR